MRKLIFLQAARVLLLIFSVVIIFGFLGCRPRQRPSGTITRREPGVDPSQLIDYYLEGGKFELPVTGASGYAAMDIPVYDSDSNIIYTLNAGQGFTILREQGEWWYIDTGNITGWVLHLYCFINLPDIIPSIVYNNTNTYSSMFRSSFTDIPNITGMPLYRAMDFNVRLGRDEYIMPVLYGMAEKILRAQRSALADGNTLVIYEAFRPAEAHNLLHEHFSQMIEENPYIEAGITAENFNVRWFLAESPYNHQRGTAIDTSLARIEARETRASGPYRYMRITSCTEYPMQTPIHELSVAAAIMSSRVNSRSASSWRSFPVLDIATPGTVLLFTYCTEAGLTPLSSEWWHYNDLEYTELAVDMDFQGDFLIEVTYSRPPEL